MMANNALIAALLTIATGAVHVETPRMRIWRSVRQVSSQSPLAGTWVADLKRSRLDAKLPITDANLTVRVDGDKVTLTSAVIMSDGSKQEGTETLQTDGRETSGTLTPGIVHVANWVGPHVLAFIAKKGDRNIALVTYEVSAHSQTLTARRTTPLDQLSIVEA
jgi:hypothetical protein